MIVEYYNFNESDESRAIYDRIKSWAPDHFPDAELIPKLGCIVWDEEKADMICFLCADMSNSIPRAIIDLMQTNPEYGATMRYKAVKVAEEFICLRLRANGYTFIVGTTPHAGVASLSTYLGYDVHPRALAGFTKQI